MLSRKLTRRTFIVGSVGAGFMSPPARSQPSPKAPRVGVLWHAGSEEEERIPLVALRQGFADLGYVEGRSVILENRFPDEKPERFKTLAVELAEAKVDVFVAVTRAGAAAAKRATSTIPIVFVAVPDPVGSKIVDHLARPGGNITGLSSMAVEVTPKRVELLKDAVPTLSHVGLLVNMGDPEGAQRYIDASQAVAGRLGVSVRSVAVRSPDDFERTFAEMRAQNIQGLVLTQDGIFYVNSAPLASLALRYRLPAIAYAREMAEAGFLMSYGPNIPATFRRVAIFVDKILKGANPGTIPVEQPTSFEIVVNAKTAKAIGHQIPTSLLSLADESLD